MILSSLNSATLVKTNSNAKFFLGVIQSFLGELLSPLEHQWMPSLERQYMKIST